MTPDHLEVEGVLFLAALYELRYACSALRGMREANIFYKPSRASAEAAGTNFAELGYTWRGAQCAWYAFRALSRHVSMLRAALPPWWSPSARAWVPNAAALPRHESRAGGYGECQCQGCKPRHEEQNDES